MSYVSVQYSVSVFPEFVGDYGSSPQENLYVLN